MFRDLFGKRKKDRPDPSTADSTIQSARAGDVVVIAGFGPLLEDAYFIVERRHRYESSFGRWYELRAVEGDRHVGIDWSDEGGELSISVTEQDTPMGLTGMGLDYDALVRLDEEQSLDNFITYNDERYYYKNSYEAYYFQDDAGEGEGFYLWEFASEDQDKMVSVVKYEGMPFEAYASEAVSPDAVSVYKKS